MRVAAAPALLPRAQGSAQLLAQSPGALPPATWQGLFEVLSLPRGGRRLRAGAARAGPFSSLLLPTPRDRKGARRPPLLPPPLKLPCSCPLAPTGKRAQCWVLELKIWAGGGTGAGVRLVQQLHRTRPGPLTPGTRQSCPTPRTLKSLQQFCATGLFSLAPSSKVGIPHPQSLSHPPWESSLGPEACFRV